MDQLISKNEFETLERNFSSCFHISDPNDTWLFTQTLANMFDGIVQYNEQSGGFDIASVCQYMNNMSQTPYENLVLFFQVKKCSVYFFNHFARNIVIEIVIVATLTAILVMVMEMMTVMMIMMTMMMLMMMMMMIVIMVTTTTIMIMVMMMMIIGTLSCDDDDVNENVKKQ